MSKYSKKDIEEIKARVSLVDLIMSATPLKKNGCEWTGCCPFHQEKTPSFTVNEEKGFYHCFGCDAHGDAISFLTEYKGMSFNDAVDDLAKRAGLAAGDGVDITPAPKIKRKTEQELRAEKQKQIEHAKKIWDESVKAEGTPVERYLNGRGIDIEKIGGMPPTIRFHERLKHIETNSYMPAMVCYIQAANRQFIGIHRTYLEFDVNNEVVKEVLDKLDGARVMSAPSSPVVKANVVSAKKTLGLVSEGAIRFAPVPDNGILAIAEGVETALSVMQAKRSEWAVWAGVSLNNLPKLKLPQGVKEVLLFVDNDEKDLEAAEKIKQKAAKNLAKQVGKAHIIRPPEGMDFNDLLLQGAAHV